MRNKNHFDFSMPSSGNTSTNYVQKFNVYIFYKQFEPIAWENILARAYFERTNIIFCKAQFLVIFHDNSLLFAKAFKKTFNKATMISMMLLIMNSAVEPTSLNQLSKFFGKNASRVKDCSKRPN